jgi:hypothetical protein
MLHVNPQIYQNNKSLLKHRKAGDNWAWGVLLHWYEGWDKFTYIKQKEKEKTKPKYTLQIGQKIKTQKETLRWSSRHPIFIGVNKVEMLVLLLPHGRQREFLAWDDQIGPVILGRLHWLQVDGILLYVMSHLLISTIWDVIPYQHLILGHYVS